MKLGPLRRGQITLSGFSGAAVARDRDHDRYSERNQYITSYCANHDRTRDCQKWRRDGRNWQDSDYRGFYERNHRGNDNGAVAAIFGFVAGAAIASSTGAGLRYEQREYRTTRLAEGNSPHQRACAARYPSYDSRSDSFMAADGQNYYCEL